MTASQPELITGEKNRPKTGGEKRSGVVTKLGRKERLQSRVLAILLGILSLAAAEIIARNELVSRFVLPPPSGVALAFIRGFESGLYWTHLASTLVAVAGGFFMAAIISTLLAGLVTGIPILEGALMPYVIAFQTLPKIAIAPLVVLWLGFGESSKTFIVVIVCFFPMFINTMQGLRIRNREHYELLAGLGATRTQILRYIRLPSALPYIFAGLHIGIVFALIGAIVAEFVGSKAGMGYLMIQQKAQFNVSGVYAVLLVLMILGLILHYMMVMIERRVAFWAEDVSVTSV